MPAARMPFVGRREEMAALEDEFARAAVGEFRVVLLSGEAGVGKSRLSLRDRVAAGLAGAGLERPEVTVEIVDRFERPGGPAKLKRLVPLEAAPAPLSAGQ